MAQETESVRSSPASDSADTGKVSDMFLKFFSKERLAELKECFILIDQNNLGFISANDVGRALRAIGQNPKDEEISKLLEYACFEDSSTCTLTLHEFLQTLTLYNFREEPDMHDDLSEALKVFDKQDTGRLTAKQFETSIRTYAKLLADEDIVEMMSLAEVDDDGTFDHRVFLEKLISK